MTAQEAEEPDAKRPRTNGGPGMPPLFSAGGYTEASDGWFAHSGGEWLHNKTEMAYFHLPTGQIRVVLDDAELPAADAKAEVEQEAPKDDKGPLFQGRVRWFNTVKGFGFIEPLGEATAILEGKAAWAFEGSDGVPHRKVEKNRIEELLEQQTHLMMRHLQLTEDHSKSNLQFMFQTAKDMLKKVDPSVRSIFADWHKELRAKTNIYVAQSRLWSLGSSWFRALTSAEAKKSWSWPLAYKAKAQPTAAFEASQQGPYDVDAAFAGLRQRHAREAQEFVLAHQKACLEQISGDLSLGFQCELLLSQVKGWLQLNGSFFREPNLAEQLLTQQARCFAELACREEMAKAEHRIQEAGFPYPLVLAIRVLLLLLSIVAPSLERICSVIAVLFSLFCGFGLFAEDTFAQSVQLLLGPLPQYLAVKMQLSSDLFVHRNQIVAEGETEKAEESLWGVLFREPAEQEPEAEDGEGSEASSVEVDVEEDLKCGFCQDKAAGKESIEDFLVDKLKLPINVLGETATCVFHAVFDGHGGPYCAEHVSTHLAKNILARLRDRATNVSDEVAVKTAIAAGFKQTEHNFLQHAKKTDDSSGSTACTMTVFGPDEQMRLRLFMANCGDSRAVL
eukprot:s223_g12.t1